MEFHHVSVLLEECIEGLGIKEGGIYLDGTLGGAGHGQKICQTMKNGRYLGLDKDPDALSVAKNRLAEFSFAEVISSDFSQLKEVLEERNIEKIDGILLDIGVSSHQLDTPERGFSYHRDGPLDMRMSQGGVSAYDVVNGYSQEELIRIFKVYGEEKFAVSIGKKIVGEREKKPINSTLELVEVIKSALPASVKRKEKHPAKQVFQSIRIEVNQELAKLQQGIEDGFFMLKPGGRMAIITFHSLEDRMVKHMFQSFCTGCVCPKDFPICICHETPKGKLIYKKPRIASSKEIEENARSKSAKLRVIEKL